MIAPVFFVVLFLLLWAGAYFVLPPLARAARAAGRRPAIWLRAHERYSRPFGRLEPYLPLLLALALGAAIVVWAADSFTDLARHLKAHDPRVQSVDHAVYDWFSAHRSRARSLFFIGATDFGSPVGMALVILAVGIPLLIRKRYRCAAYLIATAAGGAALDAFLKRHYVRPRPDLAVAVMQARGYSFPSGHAMGSTFVLGAVAYLAVRALQQWRSKSAALALAATLIAAIAISRLYLGVHWTSDVVAGIIAGLLWVTATTGAYEMVRQYRLGRGRSGALLNTVDGLNEGTE